MCQHLYQPRQVVRALLVLFTGITTVLLGVSAGPARAVVRANPAHLHTAIRFRAAVSGAPTHRRRSPLRPLSAVTFSPGTGYDSGSTPQGIVLGSVTGHAASPDIITANGSGDSVSALLNKADGSGQFSEPATVSPAGAGVAVSQVALGDFNGGGKLDAVVVSGTSTVSVMLGDGHGGFGPATTVGTLPGGQIADSVKVADLTGNGQLDIIVEGTQPNACFGNGESATAVLLGNGDGTFQSPVEYPTGDCGNGFGNYGSTDTGLAVADLTGNGHPDIVVTSHSTDTGSDVGRVFVLLNQGNGTFGSPAYVGGAPGIYGVAVADLNGDDYPDLAVGEAPITGSQRGISIFYGNGDGTFQSPVYIADPALTDGTNTAGQVTGIAIADMNGDGIPDIVTAASASLNGGPGGTSVYVNGGGSGVNAPTFIPAPSTFAPQGLALGDVNGDGKADVVLENNQPVDQNHPANVLVMLNTTPAAVAPAQTTGGGVPGDYQTTCSGCPVNTATGEFYKSFTDLQIPGRGMPWTSPGPIRPTWQPRTARPASAGPTPTTCRCPSTPAPAPLPSVRPTAPRCLTSRTARVALPARPATSLPSPKTPRPATTPTPATPESSTSLTPPAS